MAQEPITLGLMFFNTEVKISPSIFRRKISFSDSTIVSAEGMIEYNVPTAEFRISKPEKLKNLTENGNYLALNTGYCMVRGEGKLNLSLDPGAMNMQNFGTIDYFIIPDSTRIHMAMAIDFPFSEKGLDRFTNQIESTNLGGINLMRTPYAMVMENLLDSAEFVRLKNEQELLGKYKKIPEALEHTMFLADLWMKWDTLTKSYVSYGNIGIASVGKTQLNRYAKGTIEFTKKRNGDEFTFYIEITKDDWFFFNFRNNVLQALSSDLVFNDIIRKEAQSKSEQKRVSKLARGFAYTLATDRKKREFLRKFQNVDDQ